MQVNEYSPIPSSDIKEEWVVSDHIGKPKFQAYPDDGHMVNKQSTDSWTSSLGQVAGVAMLATICGSVVHVTDSYNTSLHPNASTLSSTSAENIRYFNDERALLVHELRQYAFLENGWDGDSNDRAPSKNAINEAIAFVDSLPPFIPLPEPMVSSDGEAGLYWNNGHVYLDVGFRGIGQCVFFGKCEDVLIKGSEPIATGKMLPAKLASFISSSFSPNAV
ncbi:MAG: hypothetical protein COA41_15390 [Sphingopyxis sp.]|nr:MAG: hypothetical protein COA41_15390 [Sphingopyxis sp.]